MSKVTYDNFSENLKLYLNRLLSASQVVEQAEEMIGDVDSLNTTNKTSIVAAINELAQICNGLLSGEEEVEMTSDSFSIVDINTEGATSNGTLVNDLYASHGQCYQGSCGSTKCLYSADFTEVKFGNYAVCLRVNSNMESPDDVMEIKIFNGGTEIKSTIVNGADFTNNGSYEYIYSTFEYEGNGSAKSNLRLEVNLLTAESVIVKFDYAYINMIMPAVYL